MASLGKQPLSLINEKSPNGICLASCRTPPSGWLVLVDLSKEQIMTAMIKLARKLFHTNQSLIPKNFIDKLEDILHGFLGILLFLIAVLAVFFSVERLLDTQPFFPTGMIQGINDILLVVIIIEIMRTVVVRFTDGIFQLDSFLIIGVIAAVRHLLTVGAALTMEKDKTTEAFNRSLMEMGVNTGIVVALVFALFLSRSARKSEN